MTINIPSVITRHRLSADGPSNKTALENEVKKIKDIILFEIGLSSFLGPKLLKKFKQLDYRYKAFHESEIFEDNLFPLLSVFILTGIYFFNFTTLTFFANYC